MQYQIAEIEDIHQKFQTHIETRQDFRFVISDDDVEKYRSWIYTFLHPDLTSSDIEQMKPKGVRNSYFLKIARKMVQDGELSFEQLSTIEHRLRVCRGKSHSGVLVITVFTSAYPTYTNEQGEKVTQTFSCKWNCYYCPSQPGQPRSYLEGEPGVLRANKYKFDCKQQMWGRMEDLYDAGHAVDKLEVLVLGGTWESYPEAYREEFIRDIYYSANTFGMPENSRPNPQTLDQERYDNRHSMCKVIGITLETRPDTITPSALTTMRRYGCTRIQIGIQHLNNGVLKKVNRKCTYEQVVQAIQLLKDWGYKIDAHFMPNLPGSTPELDRTMLVDQLLGMSIEPYMRSSEEYTFCPEIQTWTVYQVTIPDIQVDQWKVYPCETVPYTVIEKWLKEGKYKPYSEEELTPILLDMKEQVFPWIRLNRIVRDIPSDYIMASGDHPNLRQDLQRLLRKRGSRCRCIRCREVKLQKYDEENAHYMVREYPASNGVEFFISCEDKQPTKETLYGFVRLRIPSSTTPSPDESIQNHAWIRELHVYGLLQKTITSPPYNSTDAPTQHKGVGRKLMSIAESIASSMYHKTQLLVIAGEGTKKYYERLGYTETVHNYMHKFISHT
jgi:histone acetyltransferase (RNA polymerase elongator complex component)